MLTKIETQAMDAIIGIHREMRKANEVDWEQRRYEIAKDVVCANICSPIVEGVDPNPSVECLVKHAFRVADAMIEELKKSK